MRDPRVDVLLQKGSEMMSDFSQINLSSKPNRFALSHAFFEDFTLAFKINATFLKCHEKI